MASFIIRSRVIICALFLLGPLLLSVEQADAQVGAAPLLRLTSVTSPVSTDIAVQGDGFSPGGLVRIAVYDLWGDIDFGHAMFVASSTTYGPDGSQDPAQGYAGGGRIDGRVVLIWESTYGPNGSQDPAQGYVATNSSSGASAALDKALYGTNGSQDPAQGYYRGGGAPDQGVNCTRDVMVRAYDFKTQAWSNLLDVKAGC